VTDPTCRGQPWYNPLRVRESRLSWRLDASGPPSGGTVWIRSPGACSRAATLRESEDCACRGLDACCNPFGGGRMAPKPGLISGAATPRAKSAVATSEDGSRPSRGTGLRLTSAPVWAVPPSGGTVRPYRLRGVRVKTVQIAGVRARPLSGGRDQALCRTPTYGPGLSREARCPRLCSDGTSHAALRNGALRGRRPADSCGPVEDVYGPGSDTESSRHVSLLCRPQGRIRKTAWRVPAATLEAHRTV